MCCVFDEHVLFHAETIIKTATETIELCQNYKLNYVLVKLNKKMMKLKLLSKQN